MRNDSGGTPPLSQGSLRGAPGGNAHDNLLQIVTAPPVPGIGGESPLTISHGNLLQIVTAPPVPGNVTGWKSRQRTKAPLAKGGCPGLPRRGDSPGEAWELLTYYLFTIH